MTVQPTSTVKMTRKCSKLMPTLSQRKAQQQLKERSETNKPEEHNDQRPQQPTPINLMKSLTLSRCIRAMNVRQGGDRKFLEFREPFGKLQERLNAWRDSLWFAPADLPEALKTIKFTPYYVPYILFSGKYLALEGGVSRVNKGFQMFSTNLPNYSEAENPDLPFKKENVRDVGPWDFKCAHSLNEFQALVNKNAYIHPLPNILLLIFFSFFFEHRN